ncbi:MAG: apolipoprotein N-acyltransferase [Candidatus Omnitrophica bacterium]|nr:apolipoprotein N-acyltransferase [Candidatus Omnitrophota bacterium]
MLRSLRPQAIRNIFLILLSAVLLVIPYCRQGFWVTAWFAFVPLFFALQYKRPKQSFLIAYLAGIISWAGTIYWLVHITLPGTIVLILYLALYFGFFGLAVSYLSSSKFCLLSIPSAWVFLEYARSHVMTGFPWALLGYSQYKNLPVIQIADIFGVWGVSFLVVAVNVFLFRIISSRPWVPGNKIRLIFPVLLIILTLGYGYYRLSPVPNTQHQTTIKISVVQGNIPQSLKWKIGSEDFIFNRYLELTSEAIKDKPDLIIWPEAALPVVLEEDLSYYDYLTQRVKESGVPLLFGAVTQREGFYYNSALLLDKEGKLSGRYDKVHLVPFGEYIPLRKVFPFLQTVVPIGDVEAGKEYTIFQVPNKLGVLICFEDLFPEISRAYTLKGAGLLVNITNDAWYKYTSASFQHLQASVFRAVENRLPLARAANTGVSCFILPDGKVVSMVKDAKGEDIFIKGFVTEDISFKTANPSLFTRYGDYFPVFCLIFAFLPLIIRKIKHV